MCIEISTASLLMLQILDNIQNSSIHSLLSSKYHEAQMYQLNIHAEIPDPVIHSYLTDLDLAVGFRSSYE
mgnify:CR=1 FL=1